MNWPTLRLKIEDQIETKVSGILAGTPQSFDAYRESVGYIRALNDVLNWARDPARPKTEDESEGET